MDRKPYPSDLRDKQWTILEPVIPPARPGGRPRKADLRGVVNALPERDRNGGTWRALPHDSPPWATVYHSFEGGKGDGPWLALNDALRRRVRCQEGREPTPGAGSLDSQGVTTTEGGGEHGSAGATRITGRERPLVVETRGGLPAAVGTGATGDEAAAAPQGLGERSKEASPRREVLWAGGTDHNPERDEGVSEDGWDVIEVVSRPPGSKGFVLVKGRWVVGRTFAWRGRCRIPSTVYERLTDPSEAEIPIGRIQLMLRRLSKTQSRDRFRDPRPRRERAA